MSQKTINRSFKELSNYMQHNHIPLKFHRVLVIFLSAITRNVEDVRQRAVNFNFVDCFMVQLQLNVQLRIGGGSGNRFEVVERLVSEKWPLMDRKSRVAAHLKPPAVFPFVVAVAQNCHYELEIFGRK